MRISHRHEFVFVHIPRTGGGTVSRVLADYADRPVPTPLLRALRNWPFPRDPRRTLFSVHATADDVRRRWPRETYERYFKFAFVRNPFSWLVSLFARIGSSPRHRHHARVSRLSFTEYVRFEIKRNRRHQHRFVCASDGALIVDFIGRLERLGPDLSRVGERLGLPLQTAKLPQVGPRLHAPWQTFYDDATRQAVERHWRRDLELFGYSFESAAERLETL